MFDCLHNFFATVLNSKMVVAFGVEEWSSSETFKIYRYKKFFQLQKKIY